MGRACCIPGCKSGVKIPSHKFPKNPEKCAEWIKSLNLDHLKHYSADQLKKWKVCYKHFHECDYTSYKHRILLSIAVPFIQDVQQSNSDNIEIMINNNESEQQNILQQNGNDIMEQQEQVAEVVDEQNIFQDDILVHQKK